MTFSSYQLLQGGTISCVLLNELLDYSDQSTQFLCQFDNFVRGCTPDDKHQMTDNVHKFKRHTHSKQVLSVTCSQNKINLLVKL